MVQGARPGACQRTAGQDNRQLGQVREAAGAHEHSGCRRNQQEKHDPGLGEGYVISPCSGRNVLSTERLGGRQQRSRQSKPGKRDVQHDGPLGPTRERDDSAEGTFDGEEGQGRNRDDQHSSVGGRRGDHHGSEQRHSQNRQNPVRETKVQGATDDDEARGGSGPQSRQPQPGTGRGFIRVRSSARA